MTTQNGDEQDSDAMEMEFEEQSNQEDSIPR